VNNPGLYASDHKGRAVLLILQEAIATGRIRRRIVFNLGFFPKQKYFRIYENIHSFIDREGY
jgi:hypothetical protein